MLKAVGGSASVLLQGRDVGRLTFRAGGSSFHYTDDLLDPGHNVLGQVFEESPRRQFREPVGLPAWFANLLPERGSGLRSYYAAMFGEREVDDARLLLSLGSDLPGAVVVQPIEIPADGVLVEASAARIDAAGGVHLSALAGAQRKMSVLRDGERLTLPAAGEGGGWIAKLPDPQFPGLTENEYLMMRWAAASGLDVPQADLVPAAGIPPLFDTRLEPGASVFVVERFDRTGDGHRIHMEDLAQVTDRLPLQRDRDATYDAIGRLVHVLTGPEGFTEYLCRLVAMVLMGNADAHLKNWSLWYPDGRTARLSPAYDLVCTSVYKNVARALTFTLGGHTRAESVDAEAFRAVASASSFPVTEADEIVRGAAARMRDAWSAVRQEDLFPDLVRHVDKRLSEHSLLS